MEKKNPSHGNKLSWSFLVVVLSLLFIMGLESQSVYSAQFLPFDRAGNDKTFLRFRESLLDAVKARDIDKVVSFAAQDISTSFGGEGGRKEFRDLLRQGAKQGGTPNIWIELELVLTMGGDFSEDATEFIAPYTWLYEADEDKAFETWFVVKKDVPMYDTPNTTGVVVENLDYEVVEQEGDWDPELKFVNVKLDDGRSGFISTDHLRHLLDYRAGFLKTRRGWRLKYFVAGD